MHPGFLTRLRDTIMHPLSLLQKIIQDMTLTFLWLLLLIVGYDTMSRAILPTTPEWHWSPIPGYPAKLQPMNYIMLHCWYVIMKLQGHFTLVSPFKMQQPAKVEQSTKAPKNRPKWKPPDIILRHILLLLFITYSMTVKATMQWVRTGSMERHQFGILPLTLTFFTLHSMKLNLPQLNQKPQATPPRQPLPVAFTPPKNPCTDCENIELFSLLSALQEEGGQGMQIMAFEPNSYRICINMGVLACLSNDTSHFISLNPIQQMTINSIHSGLEVKGVGMIRWLVLDDKQNEVELTVKNALLIPDTPVCLLFPQQIIQ